MATCPHTPGTERRESAAHWGRRHTLSLPKLHSRTCRWQGRKREHLRLKHAPRVVDGHNDLRVKNIKTQEEKPAVAASVRHDFYSGSLCRGLRFGLHCPYETQTCLVSCSVVGQGPWPKLCWGVRLQNVTPKPPCLVFPLRGFCPSQPNLVPAVVRSDEWDHLKCGFL